MKAKQNTWKAFNIPFPKELVEIYDFLQTELDWALSDPASRTFLETVNLSAHRGDQWREMHDKFYGQRVAGWTLNNKAWFARIFYENLRRELESKNKNSEIFDLLEANEFKIDSELWDWLEAAGLYASKGWLKNLAASGKRPQLARRAGFQLDYSASDKQMFKKEGRYCEFKVEPGRGEDAWFSVDIDLPYTLSGEVTGVIAKPRFVKRKGDGRYVGVVSYEVVPEVSPGPNTLGVDLGQVRLFTARALFENGEPSEAYTESRRLRRLASKIDRLYSLKAALRAKIERAGAYGPSRSQRQLRREAEYQAVSAKIERLKEVVARGVASEVVELAVRLDCGEVHLENLAWLESKGGSWNHSQVQKFIMEKAVERGVRTFRVNAAWSSSTHSISEERGREVGRDIVFESGERVDRDNLASLNMACRQPGKKRKPRVPKTLKKGRATPRRVRPRVSPRTIERVKRLKEASEIVLASPSRVFSAARPTITVVEPQNPSLDTRVSINDRFG